MSRILPRIADFLAAGVEWVWLIDPWKRYAKVFTKEEPAGRLTELLRTENPLIEVPVSVVLNPDPER